MTLVSNGTCYASGKCQGLDKFVPLFSPEEIVALAAIEREKDFTTRIEINIKNRKPYLLMKIIGFLSFIVLYLHYCTGLVLIFFFFFSSLIFWSCTYEVCCLGTQIIDVNLIK